MNYSNIILFLLITFSFFYMTLYIYILTDIKGFPLHFITPNKTRELKSTNSIIHETWTRYKTEKYVKQCSSYYIRMPCIRHIENHVCYKYKYYFRGFLRVTCISNRNTAFI